MNDIQIALKANEENGTLSIQGVDVIYLIDMDWNWDWDNVSSIKNPLLKSFFMQAEKLFQVDKSEEDEEEVYEDSSYSSLLKEETVSWIDNDLLKDFVDQEDNWQEDDDQCFDEAILDYDIDEDSDRIKISLLTPSHKIIWDESVYRYIYDNLNLWVNQIEEAIKIYKELGRIINDIDKIISIIRTANCSSKAAKMLIQQFDISEPTAETILGTTINRLISLPGRCDDIVQYQEEHKALLDKLIILKKEIA